MRYVVQPGDTAAAVGSGDVPVLATPRLLALAEAASVEAVAADLTQDQTSVGSRAVVEHLAPSAVGAIVDIDARLVHRDGRLLRFEITVSECASDGDVGRLVGRVELTRVVVERTRFLRGLQADR